MTVLFGVGPYTEVKSSEGRPICLH